MRWILVYSIALTLSAKFLKADPTDFLFIVDQSTSMDFNSTNSFAYIKPAVGGLPADTSYYANSAGCPSGTTANGSNTNGTLQVGTVFVYLLKSNTGCSAPSGDPFGTRVSAVAKAIDTIAKLSASSTAGYLPFAQNVVTGSQRPLVMTSTNATTLKNKITLQSFGGTIFDRPLDSAKRWLSAPLNLGKNDQRAIIFISDGSSSPADSDGTRFADATIPIYGIFLGKVVTPDTSNLLKITNLTRPAGVAAGANFYRVDPGHPDSVQVVMQRIVKKILSTVVPIQPKRLSSLALKNSDVNILRVDMRGRSAKPATSKNAKTPAMDFSETVKAKDH